MCNDNYNKKTKHIYSSLDETTEGIHQLQTMKSLKVAVQWWCCSRLGYVSTKTQLPTEHKDLVQMNKNKNWNLETSMLL